MTTPTVSVIIPAYNSEQTLSRCLDSVLRQSFGDFEVILVDDGSTDRTGAICDDYAARDSRLRVIHQANVGPAETRRVGVDRAAGEYIVFVDSDDTVPADALDILVRHIAGSDLDMVFGCYDRIIGNRQHAVCHTATGVLTADEFLHHLLSPGCICAQWGAISRRALWTAEVFPPRATRLPSEDVFTNILLTARLQRVELLNEVVYHYHYIAGSLSLAGPLHHQHLWKQHFALLRQNLHARGLLESCEQQLRAMEVERLAFCTQTIDTDESWYRQVVNYRSSSFTPRTKLLIALLHHPHTLRQLIALNRRLRGRPA